MNEIEKLDLGQTEGEPAEPHYCVFEEASTGHQSDNKVPQTSEVLTVFCEGSLLERKAAALEFIKVKVGEKQATDDSGTGFVLTTYSIKGYLVARGVSYPIFYYSTNEEEYIDPWQYASNLLGETEYLEWYFRDSNDSNNLKE